MHTPIPASARACTPPHQRKHAPLNYGRVAAGPATDHLLAEPPKPKRPPKLLYPALPDAPNPARNAITPADFDRAAFLRTLAQHNEYKGLCSKHLNDGPLADAVWQSAVLLRDRLREDFRQWMETCNGLAGTGTEGGAA